VTEPAPLERDAQRYRLYGVERALDTLELLAAAGPGGMTLTELAEQISVSKSSAFALLQTLIARGFVADSGSRLTRRYRLGLALAKLGDAAEVQSPLISVAMPVMQSVTDATGLTTRLVVPDGPYAVVSGSTRTARRPGRRCFPRSRPSRPGPWRWRPVCRPGPRGASPTPTPCCETWS
jgi:DNA-binding IclR family transcriptional regulator